MKRKSKASIPLRNTLLFFTCIAMLLSLAYRAEAMNEDYLYAEKWYNNPAVNFEEPQQNHSIGYTLNGVFGYYADSDMCLYTYFSVNEDSMLNEGNDVRIAFQYFIEGETYRFSVSKDGVCDALSEEVFDRFSVSQQFTEQSGGAVCLAAVQYLGKAALCQADIRLYINGHNYIIKEGLTYERPTTTKPPTTERTTQPKTQRGTTQRQTKTTTQKATKQTSQKETTLTQKETTTVPATKFTPSYVYTTQRSVAEVSTAAASTKSNTKTKAQGTTQFVPAGTALAAADGNTQTQTDEQSTDAQSDEQTVLVKEAMSAGSKRLLIVAVATAAAGLFLLFSSAVAKNKSTDNNEKEVS